MKISPVLENRTKENTFSCFHVHHVSKGSQDIFPFLSQYGILEWNTTMELVETVTNVCYSTKLEILPGICSESQM